MYTFGETSQENIEGARFFKRWLALIDSHHAEQSTLEILMQDDRVSPQWQQFAREALEQEDTPALYEFYKERLGAVMAVLLTSGDYQAYRQVLAIYGFERDIRVGD